MSHDSQDIVQQAAQQFFDKVREKERIGAKRQDGHEKIINEKSRLLIPMRKLLKRLVDAGVYVSHHAIHDPGNTIKTPYAPQLLSVWEGESSPMWSPGGSLFLDHPALIEIAITNPHQREQSGLIVISCSSVHPDSHILRGPFLSVDDACLALAGFLSGSTLRIDRPD